MLFEEPQPILKPAINTMIFIIKLKRWVKNLFIKKESISLERYNLDRRRIKSVDITGDEKKLYISGSKYAMNAVPRREFLDFLDPVKHKVEELIMDTVVKMVAKELPESLYSKPIKEISRVFDELIEAETEAQMRTKWKKIKKFICAFLEEDVAYRYRFQWFIEHLDVSKVKLSDADKYYFRPKRFKVDS